MKKYAEFQGRAKRSEFWWFNAFQFLAVIGVALVATAVGLSEDAMNMVSGVVGLVLMVPTLAVTARRLHDTNRSGWWMFIPVTLVGVIPYLYWLCKAGDPQDNQYGTTA
jgi:uncharacterized membrane protein YhaH (DUF805 family)